MTKRNEWVQRFIAQFIHEKAVAPGQNSGGLVVPPTDTEIEGFIAAIRREAREEALADVLTMLGKHRAMYVRFYEADESASGNAIIAALQSVIESFENAEWMDNSGSERGAVQVTREGRG